MFIDIVAYLWSWLIRTGVGLDLLIGPLQSLVITTNYNKSQYIFSSILIWSLSVLIWTTTDSILIWTASYTAYPYLRKRLLIPQRRVGFQESVSVETAFIFVSQEKCYVTHWFPRIRLRGNIFHIRIAGNVFRNELVSKNLSPWKQILFLYFRKRVP
jgi:hypothetical protein